MNNFKKALTACAMAAVMATLCFTVFPARVSATNGLSQSDPVLDGSYIKCIRRPGGICADMRGGSVYLNYLRVR